MVLALWKSDASRQEEALSVTVRLELGVGRSKCEPLTSLAMLILLDIPSIF